MSKNKPKHTIEIINQENGAIFVEAAIVLPIVFFVLFFILFMGDVYYQMAKVDDIVARAAIKGAQCAKDPLLYDIYEEDKIPLKNSDVQPYRYLIGSYDKLEKDISDEVIDEINNSGILLFAKMKPDLMKEEDIAKFTNYVFYSTFSVDVVYDIRFPIALFGQRSPTLLVLSSRSEIAVNDTSEFIRNVDMVIDMISGTEISDKIASVFNRVNEFLRQFGN